MSDRIPFDELTPAQLAELYADLEMLRDGHDSACRTIADMHAAAVGEVTGPIRGVVEDVADLRERALRAEGGLAPALWPTIRALSAWLDAENGRGDHEMAMRFLKISEEVGEAAAAYIGWRGQNPRKGITHTRADVEDELCDAITSSAVTLAMLSDDPEAVFAAKLAKIAARAGVAGVAR